MCLCMMPGVPAFLAFLPSRQPLLLVAQLPCFCTQTDHALTPGAEGQQAPALVGLSAALLLVHCPVSGGGGNMQPRASGNGCSWGV